MSGRALALLVGDADAVRRVSALADLLVDGGWDVQRAERPPAEPPAADLVLCGDADELARMAVSPVVAPTLCPVVPADPSRLFAELVLLLPPEVVAASRLLVCADEVSRGIVESLAPSAAGRTVVVDTAAGRGHPRLEEAVREIGRRVRPEDGGLSRGGRPLRVVVAGHALHFLAAVIEHLQASPDVDLRVDHVPSFNRHDESRSAELVQWADVVLCEWCSPLAIWYSRHKRPGQRLLVRLHRYELYREWPGEVDIDAVDQVVLVSRHYARLTEQLTGWPAAKLSVVPNYVDVFSLARPKRAGAEHCVGFLGMLPPRKRVDLALDVLERLRRRDPRYWLSVKTRMPWDSWGPGAEDEVAYVTSILRRIATTPELCDAVSWEPYGSDVGTWLTGVGFVLSTSDDESFHLSPAEGMASGAVPVIRHWPGADTIYDDRWLHADAEGMADSIDHTVRSGAWAQLGADAQAWCRASFDVPVVTAMIRQLLVGDGVS